MSGDRPHEEVVADLLGTQARLRGDEPTQPDEAVAVIEKDVAVSVGGLFERMTQLERDLAGIEARLDQLALERPRVIEWRRLPEFNLCPPMLELTLDDRIALLQTEIAEGSRPER